MTDEEVFKKIFLLQDSAVEGERVAAFNQLHAFLEKRKRKFADLLTTLTDNVPRTVYAELEQKLAAAEKKYNDLHRDHAILKNEFAALKTILWARTNWRVLALAAIVLAIIPSAYEFWPDATAAERQDIDASLNAVAERSGWDSGYSTPAVHMVGNTPYWTILYGEILSDEQADADGKPVTLQCLHLYAAPATVKPTLPDPDRSPSIRPPSTSAAARVRDTIYMKPSPFNLFGWLNWPEHAVVCRHAQSKEASR
jgi:hypothetical protein